MPSWIPGEDHLINFQKGDPYVKLDEGYARLPGKLMIRAVAPQDALSCSPPAALPRLLCHPPRISVLLRLAGHGHRAAPRPPGCSPRFPLQRPTPKSWSRACLRLSKGLVYPTCDPSWRWCAI